VVLDASDYRGLLDRALDVFGFDRWSRECERLRAEGRPAGTGVGVFLEKSGLGPDETGAVHIDGSGRVRVVTGGASLGQGIETVLAQIAADELGVDPESVDVAHGDTDLVGDGVGSWASRTTAVGGGAVWLAARAVAEQARARGGDVRGLSAERVFSVDHMSYPFGVHLTQVELDPGTGAVTVRRYAIACELGRAINPALVEGQLAGGAAQGIAGALFEEFVYDEAGQPLSTTLTDYLMPSATEVPGVMTLVSQDWPTAGNPLGARGAGESGVSGAGAAIASAVEDALGMPGAIDRLPITPERVLDLLRTRESRSGDRSFRS
jgi:carbon-monoxide dehydrogenase large subunit/6-hydroxypseudooxynicotine dehydrogenase subunit gamma